MINKVILMGRLTADPELRQTQSGISSCRFTVAVDRRYADKNTGERKADFITVIAWRQQAEFVSRYFSKGRMIIVEGSLQNDNYTDSNGVKHYGYNVVADNVSFGESKAAAAANGGTTYTAPANNNHNYQAPPQQAAPSQPAPNNDSMSYGNLSDFEEILSDGDVPF
ncbi:MAG: single-stranded DNA-binding protein [Ruminococcus sp.]